MAWVERREGKRPRAVTEAASSGYDHKQHRGSTPPLGKWTAACGWVFLRVVVVLRGPRRDTLKKGWARRGG